MPIPKSIGAIELSSLGVGYRIEDEIRARQAGVALYAGSDFGPEGEGFFRMNIACPRKTLEKARVVVDPEQRAGLMRPLNPNRHKTKC